MWGKDYDFSKLERIGICACKWVLLPLHVLLFQKADDLRQKMVPYVPDKLQGSCAVAVGHGSVVSLTDWDFYSHSYQSSFQSP